MRRTATVLGVVIAFIGMLTSAGTAVASTPRGACGWNTPEEKVVTQYAASPRFYCVLRCGNDQYGYRHLVARHRDQFEAMAAGTFQNWRDVADLCMETISGDPDAAIPVGGGKACLSRVIFLRDLEHNQVVRQQIVKMLVVIDQNNIITAYPARQQCQAADTGTDES